jgi:alkanesulfonate monooxygenase SsuD/methylene tetrahydromethanopterin reductase-like flavin-dependent oxidoreductase (luciferase family)
MDDASVGLIVRGTDETSAVEYGVLAEELGYDSVWMVELWGDSSVVELTAIAERTSEVGIGTAIVNVYSRTPAVLAMTAATLDDVSGGRFTLGTGVSTRKAVEDLHSMSFENPVRRAHETIELTREFLTAEGRVDYEGECFGVRDFPALGTDVPVYHAALGKANRRVVGRLADGWMPHLVPFPLLDDAYDYLREHAEAAGRDGEAIEVAPHVPTAVSEDPEAARDAVRSHLGYYIGSGRGYQNAVGELFSERADDVAETWRAGDREAAVAAVTDEMVDALAVAGTPDEARQSLADLVADTCVDHPIVTPPQTAGEELTRETVELLAAGF